jgi:hypothetical protein
LGAHSYKTQHRGPDGGVDGKIFYANGPYGTGKIIISVKGGDSVGVSMARELEGVLQEQNAEMGILITLADPTAPMRSYAAGLGFVRKSAHGRMPRMQIVTVEDLLDGRMPKLPPLPRVEPGSRTIRRKKDSQLEFLLEFEGTKRKVVTDDDFVDPRLAIFS